MSVGDGNGWVHCRCGHRHWGRFGAAGLLVVRPGGRHAPAAPQGDQRIAAGDAQPQVLLQLRASWTDAGGTWGMPGGAADSHEDPTAAALREAHEEVGVDAAAVEVVTQEVTTDHGDWTYTVVVAVPVGSLTPHVANAESEEVRWVGLGDVPTLPLHSGLAGSWARLRAVLRELDVAAGRPTP